jgi:hypothetical protein
MKLNKLVNWPLMSGKLRTHSLAMVLGISQGADRSKSFSPLQDPTMSSMSERHGS